VTGRVSGQRLSELYAGLARALFPPAIYPLEARKIISANLLPNF
jgi:hypothetical protein